MAKVLSLVGANIKLYVNNTVYKEVQSINLTVDYGEKEIYGIDAEYAQELAPGKVSVKGSVSGVRVKFSGGIQAKNLRPLFTDFAAGGYVSIRIQDLSTQEDIVFIPNCKVTRENHTINKGVYKLNFDFIGQIPLFALDRA